MDNTLPTYDILTHPVGSHLMITYSRHSLPGYGLWQILKDMGRSEAKVSIQKFQNGRDFVLLYFFELDRVSKMKWVNVKSVVVTAVLDPTGVGAVSIEPSPNEKDTTLSSNARADVSQVLEMSMRHLSLETRFLMSDHKIDMTVWVGDWGRGDSIMISTIQQEHSTGRIPEDLSVALDYAHKLNCRYVLFRTDCHPLEDPCLHLWESVSKYERVR